MNNFTEQEKLELYAKQIHDSGIDITADYKDWIGMAYACASQGEAGRNPFHLISSNYSGYSREECDKHFSYCLKTSKNCVSIGTIVKIAEDHGIKLQLPKGRRPKSQVQKQEEKKAVVTATKELLQEGRRWRHNTLINKTEYSESDGEWQEVDDRFIDTMLTRLRETGLPVKDNELRSLVNSSDFAPDFAPHIEWLKSLPTWNPENDPDYIHDFFVGHMEFGPLADVELYDLMFHRWMVGLVAQWKGQIDANPLMPTFCGPQYIGKSFFTKNILPPCLRKYQTEVRPNDPINTDTMLTLSEVLLVIFDEISINSDTKSNMMKYLITSGQTNLRDAYGHYRKTRQRKASFIATTNYLQFIREAEGSRRYLGVDLTGTKDTTAFPFNHEGAYSQALYLLEHDFAPKPTADESRLISQHNKSFMAPDDCEEALRTFVRQPRENEIAVALSAGDLLRQLEMNGFHGKGFNSVNIGKAMKAMGFESKKIKGYPKYRVVLADPQRRQRETEEDAKLMQEELEPMTEDALHVHDNAAPSENDSESYFDFDQAASSSDELEAPF